MSLIGGKNTTRSLKNIFDDFNSYSLTSCSKCSFGTSTHSLGSISWNHFEADNTWKRSKNAEKLEDPRKNKINTKYLLKIPPFLTLTFWKSLRSMAHVVIQAFNILLKISPKIQVLNFLVFFLMAVNGQHWQLDQHNLYYRHQDVRYYIWRRLHWQVQRVR